MTQLQDFIERLERERRIIRQQIAAAAARQDVRADAGQKLTDADRQIIALRRGAVLVAKKLEGAGP